MGLRRRLHFVSDDRERRAREGPDLERRRTCPNYTHPLWLFLLIGARTVTGELYFTTLAASIVLSVAAVLVVVHLVARSRAAALMGVMLLAFSRSFVDFSTSGLENALAHLLIAGFAAARWRWRTADDTRLTLLSAIVALALVNRLDVSLLLAPSLLAIWIEAPSLRRAGLLAVGLLPIVAWEVFALIYYGFAMPNTAYAKLWTGIPANDLLPHGIVYLLESIRTDPLTPMAIGAAIVAGLLTRGWSGRAMAFGLVMQLAYVVRIGGDFMSGRFLTPAFMVAVCYLVQLPRPKWRCASLIPFAITLLVASCWPAWFWAASGSPPGSGPIPGSGIADERAYYYSTTGLLRPGGAWTPPRLPTAGIVERMRQAGQRVAVRDMVGMFGFAAGTDIHVVDSLGLCDPLLERLPTEGPWRIGHYPRRLPDGYIASLRKGANVIVDPNLAAYYRKLERITRGPIWEASRLSLIWRINFSSPDEDLDAYLERRRVVAVSEGGVQRGP